MRNRSRILRLACFACFICPLLAHAGASRNLVFRPADSEAAFSVRLVWFQTVSGDFPDVRGSVRIDPATGTALVDARIRVASVNVHPAHYRKRLLGPRFFDARRYPYIRFVSDTLGIDDLRNGKHLRGQLTLHGITRPLTLQLSDTRCRDKGLEGCTLHLKGWLDRTHFNMHAYRALVSRRVRLDLVIQLQAAVPGAPATARGVNSE